MKTVIGTLALALASGVAMADTTLETAGYAGAMTIDYRTGEFTQATRMTTIYDNISAPAAPNSAFSSTDLTSIWGDRMTTLGTGIINDFGFTIFNSATGNTLALTSATVVVNLFRGADGSALGGFQTTVNFGPGGLAAGFFSTVSVTGLESLGINLDTTDIIATQTVTALSGGTTRIGVASLNPLLAGTSSGTTIFVDSNTIGGGVAGFYNFGNPIINSNLGYSITVPTPGALALVGLGGLMAGRRRR